jgi:anti-anti-sigma regulatory factor
MLLHSDEAERRAAVAAWAREGLARGERIIYAEDEGVPAVQSLAGALTDHGIDASTAATHGQLIRRSPQRFYRPEGFEPEVRDALAAGFRGLRLTADSCVALSVLSPGDHLAAERGAEQLARTHPVGVLCRYDRADLPPERLQEVVGAHPTGVRERQLAVGGPPPARGRPGAADSANDDVLAGILRAATQTDGGELAVDLRALGFLGVAGARALESGTARFRSLGGRVLLSDPQPSVKRVLRVLRMDRVPGMEIIGISG